MPEMSRVTAGHGSDGLGLFKGALGGGSGRTGSMLSGINSARMHAASLEHDKWKTQQGHAQEERMAVVHHVLGQDAAEQAHGRQEHFVNSIVKHSAGGTPISFTHGDASANFVRKERKVKAAPAVAEAPIAPTPAAEPEVKQPKFAHRDPVTNKISHYETTPQVLPAKKATAKKAAPKKKK
jgi:hypothetical protein